MKKAMTIKKEMMKMLIILSCLILVNCRTSRVKKLEKKQTKVLTEKITKDSAIIRKNTNFDQLSVSEKQKEIKKQKEQEVVIKGKTEKSKPFTFHQTEDQDTISSILITGDADFVIKTKTQNKEKISTNLKENKKLNGIQSFIRESVSDETIKNVSDNIKENVEDIKKKGVQLGLYLTVFFIAIAIFLLIVFFKKFNFFNIFRKS